VAEDESRATDATFRERSDAPSLWRVVRWALTAFLAMGAVVLVGTTDLGLRRITLALQTIQGVTPQPPRDNSETQRLSESLRRIADDRERLLTRLESLEHKLDDLTGSITASAPPTRPIETNPAAVAEPAVAPKAAVVTAPTAGPANPAGPATVAPSGAPSQSSTTATAQDNPPADAPAPTAPTAAAKTDFGIDLGSAPTVEGLRALWATAKSKHGALLEGLRPIITVREPTKPGNVELRLVAGPLPSATLAARLCVAITATGTVCQPAVFDGQRLALR